MKIIRLLFSVVLFSLMIYFLGGSIQIGTSQVPPLGEFLNPFRGYLQNNESYSAISGNNLSIPGLQDEVTVAYDSMGIPHIFAKNDHDLYMTQGYIVAKHRLWQMDFQSYAAAGRLSELVGNVALELDRSQRRKGMRQTAEQNVKNYDQIPHLKEQIESYSQGVNEYINSLSYKDLPIEYKLMNYRPEKWTKLKTGLLMEYMIDMLIGSDRDLENTNALAHFGKPLYDRLFPDYLAGIQPVIPTADQYHFDPIVIQPDTIIASEWYLEKVKESDPRNGSNNWAVSGTKTRNGHPILANDPHLGLNLPSIWFVVQLHSPNVNVAGFTLTGAPGIVVGFNENNAWGVTNAPRDQRDWYSITYKDDSKQEYNHGGEWRPVSIVLDTIRIKNEEFFIDSIRWTDIGPIFYDEHFKGKANQNDLAFRWIGNEVSSSLEALNKLNRSKNYEDYLEATNYWDSPSQNLVFASNNGDIALQVAGKFPLKWKEQGKFILDASRPQHLWNGFIPHDQNPIQHNPERGFVSSANQHSVDTLYPYYYYSSTNEHYRNRRINELLTANDSITVKDFMAIQFDAVNIKAREILPILLAHLHTKQLSLTETQLIDQLINWDYSYLSENTAPTIFEYWWGSFYRKMWDEFKTELPMRTPNEYVTYHLMKTDTSFSMYDITSTTEKEGLGSLINSSFKDAVEKITAHQTEFSTLKWASYNKAKLTHLARLAPFSTAILDVPGSGDNINATNGGHGPSMRFIAELGDYPEAWISIPGGEDGNPGSKSFLAYLEYWKTGTYFKLPLLKEVPSSNYTLLNFSGK